jgi:Protein of unknown function (DUF2721)
VEPKQAIQSMSTLAVFVSGGGLLLLSLNARLSAVFSRVRALHDREETPETKRLLKALGQRARRLRNAFVCALGGVGACLASCLLMGLGAFWQAASVSAFVILLVGVLALLASVGCYLAEVLLALPSLDLSRVDVHSADKRQSHPSHPARSDAA